MKRIFFLTGRSGVGKTSVLLKTVEELRKRRFSVGGIVSREVREIGSRVGFKIFDLDTKREGWLAHTRQPRDPKVGKYKVCSEELESVGVNAILNATMKAVITVIDEIGPMERFSQAFGESVTEALNSGKTVQGTVHCTIGDHPIFEIRNREDAEIIEVTTDNQDELANLLFKKSLKT